jgi:opine dehydrogenase
MLHVTISSPAYVIHPVTLATNMGRVEDPNETFNFYRQGMTPGVATIIEKSSREMVALGKGLGYDVPEITQACDMYYPKPDGGKWSNFAEFARESFSHNVTPGDPKSLNHRYFLEDVPHGLVLLEQIAKKAGVEFDTLSAIITLASTATNGDFRKNGLTLKALGMDNLSLEEIIKCFEG